jgi:putative endonuclease
VNRTVILSEAQACKARWAQSKNPFITTMFYKLYYTYILASDSGTFYIGFTGFLEKRVFQHKEKLFEGFTQKYGVHRLLHFESFDDVHVGIARETQLKGWTRKKKIALIEKNNPQWKDLSAEWYRDIGERFATFKRSRGKRDSSTPSSAARRPRLRSE